LLPFFPYIGQLLVLRRQIKGIIEGRTFPLIGEGWVKLIHADTPEVNETFGLDYRFGLIIGFR
jgi:hypothetical protein